jgi:hypothetical protein
MPGDRQSDSLQGAGTSTQSTSAGRSGSGLADVVPAALAADRPTVVHVAL